jgi:pyruvate dehydrogenase complex dehydrogenase (E1) component
MPMIPFYIYYSMFGLQRVGDLAWLAGDMRARGFLLGGTAGRTAGRTTLNGEGLQHEDGHSHVLAGTIPNCVSYDPRRWNLLHPTEPRRKSWVEAQLEGHPGPVVASTDYMRNYPDQIREYMRAAGRRYVVLGTDGFGRSDYRVELRRFFEVDRHYVAIAALKALAGAIRPSVVAEAIAKYQMDAGRAAPWTV